jgi:vitamin B12 transporter
VKKFITPWKTQFNAAYNYASGRPYFFIYYDPTAQANKFGDRGMTKDYNNLSFSVNYLPDIGKKNARHFAVYVLSVSNALGFNNVYGYQYSYNGMHKESITPPTKYFIFLGLFLSFGIDRSDDVINSNL